MDYQKVAKNVVKQVGGVQNINSVTHCITRLRFSLKDVSVANTEAIKEIDGVVSVVNQAGQYQVVIGNEVGNVFDEVEKILQVEKKSEENEQLDRDISQEKTGILARFTSLIAGIFMPLIGLLVAAGLIKGLLSLATLFGLLSETSNTYVVLNAIGNAFFYFFPIFIGGSAARYLKLDIYLGMIIGAILVYPDLISVANSTDSFSFLGIPMDVMDYSNSVFPVVVAVLLAAYFEKILQKIIPKGSKYFLIPFIILLTVVPVTLLVVGPVITKFSDLIATISFAIFDISPILAGLVLGGTWSLLTMFGLHWAFMPIFINNIVNKGVDPMMGVLIAGSYATSGATLAIAFRGETKEIRSLALSTGLTALIGVGEPALYGILLPRTQPFIMSLIAGGVGGAIGGLMGTKVYTMAPFGLGTINPAGIDLGFYGLLVQIVVGFALAFTLTYFLGYKNKNQN